MMIFGEIWGYEYVTHKDVFDNVWNEVRLQNYISRGNQWEVGDRYDITNAVIQPDENVNPHLYGMVLGAKLALQLGLELETAEEQETSAVVTCPSV